MSTFCVLFFSYIKPKSIIDHFLCTYSEDCAVRQESRAMSEGKPGDRCQELRRLPAVEEASPTIGLRAVLLAALGVTLGLIALVGVLFVFRDTRIDPSELLPGERTMAVLHAATQEDIRRWQPLIPQLAAVPSLSAPAHIAVVQDAAGGSGLVIIPADARTVLTATAQLTAARVNGVQILVSRAELIGTDRTEPRLERSADYRALQGAAVSDQWTYLTPGVATLSPLGILRPVASARDLQGADHLSFFLPEQDWIPTSVTPDLPMFQPDASVIAVSTSEILWTHVLDPLPRALRLAADTVLRQAATRMLGDHLSLRYDVLRPLQGPVILEFPAGSGDVLLSAQGVDGDAGTWMETLAAGSQVELLDRPLDPELGFRLRAVRTGTANRAVAEETSGEWQIFRTGTLTLGTHQAGVFLTRNSLADQLLKAAKPQVIRLPSPPGSTLIAGGLMQPATLAAVLQGADPALATLLPQLTLKTPLYWSMGQKGDIRSISVTQNPAVVTPGETR